MTAFGNTLVLSMCVLTSWCKYTCMTYKYISGYTGALFSPLIDVLCLLSIVWLHGMIYSSSWLVFYIYRIP